MSTLHLARLLVLLSMFTVIHAAPITSASGNGLPVVGGLLGGLTGGTLTGRGSAPSPRAISYPYYPSITGAAPSLVHDDASVGGWEVVGGTS